LGADGDSHLEHLRYIGEFLEELPIAKLVPEPPPCALLILACTVPYWSRRKRRQRPSLCIPSGVVPVVSSWCKVAR